MMCWSYNQEGSCNCTICMVKRVQQKQQEERQKQIEFLAFVGKVASFMDILADQIKDEVQQVRESL